MIILYQYDFQEKEHILRTTTVRSLRFDNIVIWYSIIYIENIFPL